MSKDKDGRNVINITCSSHPDTPLNDKYHCDYKKQSNNNYFSNSTQGGGYSTGGKFGTSEKYGSKKSSVTYSDVPTVKENLKYELDETKNKNLTVNCYGIQSIESDGISTVVHSLTQALEWRHKNCYGSNAILNTKTLDLGFTAINDKAMGLLCYHFRDYNFDLNALYLNHNQIGDLGVQSLMFGIASTNKQVIYQWSYKTMVPTTSPNGVWQKITSISLSNNLLCDNSAKFIAEYLGAGQLPTLKVLDVSDNQITSTGTGYFLDALKKSTVGNIIIKQYHLSIFGNKENKIGFMKDYLKQAEDKGVDVKNIAVDKSLAGYIKNFGKVCKNAAIGFTKCYYVDDVVTDYATDKIVAKIPKGIPLKSGYDSVICYLEIFDEVMTSSEGVQLIKTDLEIMGENTVINGIE